MSVRGKHGIGHDGFSSSTPSGVELKIIVAVNMKGVHTCKYRATTDPYVGIDDETIRNC